ncbi:unnamed protein product [Arabis nemorensis]|uniref:Protein kinase domain-containing protein n=1 Tax=Arabis nemorensis TaxID=586526 RepID=A0A565AYP6_9BRAS|nr:unnamed protein product [Arabis nemorensis]
MKLRPFSLTSPISSSTKPTVKLGSDCRAQLIDAVHNLFVGVGVGLPCTVMECGDMIYRSTLPKSNGLTITAPGVALALTALLYLWGYTWRGSWDGFVLGKKLGEGSFGVVYRASLSKKRVSEIYVFIVRQKPCRSLQRKGPEYWLLWGESTLAGRNYHPWESPRLA